VGHVAAHISDHSQLSLQGSRLCSDRNETVTQFDNGKQATRT
jgi:hypothetical protein